MQTPFGYWMNAWASGVGLMQTGAKLAETMSAAGTVIESRTKSISNGDYAELGRMIPEKVAAFSQAAKATSDDLKAIQKDAAANARHLAEIAAGRRLPLATDMLLIFSRSSRIISRSMAVGGNALAPVHRRAVANAKRLKRGS
jgi:hypothetical protein